MRNRTLAEIILEIPAALETFEVLGLDYCCNGNRTLDTACTEDDIPLEMVLEKLRSLDTVSHQIAKDTSVESLLDQIISEHHSYIREMTPRLRTLLIKIKEVHGTHHPELFQIHDYFDQLSKELIVHLDQEEKDLFPKILLLDKGRTSISGCDEDQLPMTAQILEMLDDHDKVGELLKNIRVVSSNFQEPEDACNSYRLCFQWLKDFEKDLHAHIHLENNLLFPTIVRKLRNAT